ncbi:MAG: TonB-dependent receptor [Mangrovibacterium sp.]
MKKKRGNPCFRFGSRGNFLKKMKLLGLFFFTGLIAVSASTYSQQVKFNLKVENVTVREVFEKIEESSEFILFYNEDYVDVNRKVSINAEEKNVEYILDAVFKGTKNSYKIYDRQIVILAPGMSTAPSLFTGSDTGVSLLSQPGKKRLVSGRVVDAKTNEPLIGATVWVKESTVGTITDVEGNFTIKVDNENAILAASFIGYNGKEERIGSRSTMNFALQPSDEELEEVVVVGYGQQKKESVIGAISSVKPEQLKIPTAHISNVLAGQIGGVISIQRSGEPGEHGNFWIRGLSTSKDSNKPLVLVDGIERSMDFVDVEDIESVSVLKDATATAVYGVRGANGVILITTRTGEAGAPKVSATAYAGLVAPTMLPKFVNSYQFARYYNEATGTNSYDDHAMEMYRTGGDPDLYPSVNWMKALFKDFSWNRRANVNMSGGGSVARYYISVGYYGENGIYKTDNLKSYDSSITYDKFNFRSNIDMNLSKTTVVSVNLANIYETKTIPGGAAADIWSNAFTVSPNAFPVKYSDGTLAAPAVGTAVHIRNPYNLLTQNGYRDHYWNTSQAIMGLKQDFGFITPGLTFDIKFSWDSWSYNRLSYIGSANTFHAIGRDGDGNLIYEEIDTGTTTLSYEKETGGNRSHYLESNISYNRTFNEVHNVSAMLLYNQKSYRNLWADTGAGSVPYRNQGLAGRTTYNYANRYFAEFNFGYNGSENFSPGKRFGFFPSGALGWMISEEKFFEPLLHVVDLFKIRSSYGIVGNDNIGGGRRFIYNATFNMNAPGFTFGLPGSGNNIGGIRAAELANNDVSWETVNKLDLGVELSFFKMLKIQADYFAEHRTGIFLERDDMSDTDGIVDSTPWVNIGEVKNKGFEIQGEFFKSINKDFSLSLRGNFIYARNIVVNDAGPRWNYEYRDHKGRPVGQQWGYIAEGLFSSKEEIANSPKPYEEGIRVGDIKYRDINGDGRITNFDQVAIGRSWMPEINYGFGASAKWKQFDLSFLFQGVARVTTMFGGQAMKPFSGMDPSAANFFLDVYEKHWSLENPDPNARYPRPSARENQNNGLTSTFWQRDASYLRLRNATLGYTIPRALSEKLRINLIRFYASGQNLLTFSKIKLFDPEITNTQGAGYPPTRIISLGFNVNF